MPAFAYAAAADSSVAASFAAPKVPVEKAVPVESYTAAKGDGKIFLYDIEDVVKVRTGETGTDAPQGEEDLAND